MTSSTADVRDRHASITVGLLFLVTVGLFVAAAIGAGRLEEWFTPSQTIKILLPQRGLFGLSKGADVEILGTPAGEVQDIVIDPDQSIHAVATIRSDMKPFVSRDSDAFIRKRFGVAGSAFLDITRGFGEPMDWDYAVIVAKTERAPTESVGELVEAIRAEVLPLIGEARTAIRTFSGVGDGLIAMQVDLRKFVASLSSLAGRIDRGEGSVGRLMASDELARQLEGVLAETNDLLASLAPTVAALESTALDMAGMMQAVNAQTEDVPKLTSQTLAVLGGLEEVLQDLRNTTPKLPRITKNLADATDALPILLIQTQETAVELEALLRQLRSNWLIGGSSSPAAPTSTGRIAPGEVRP